VELGVTGQLQGQREKDMISVVRKCWM